MIDAWITWVIYLLIGAGTGVLIGILCSSGRRPESLVSDENLKLFLSASAILFGGVVSFLGIARSDVPPCKTGLMKSVSVFLAIAGAVVMIIALI